ncbi:conserved Plasmodium protein, unknown function [Plasmodium vinckei brucechwatti]|uniref:Uncharacterized protein n=1 Tax=Plasmodium vinckei brucechwatti TaxID=119398 RepID=A0A6V7S778_PLAVN|nr:conserved Plasmodium protein, unknown function [Plasmodium vinckei brucechwatti]
MKNMLTKEEKYFEEILRKTNNYNIYGDVNDNKVDKNIVKKIAILYEIFNRINKERNNNNNLDFIYTSDIKYSLKYDDFVRIRFHIIPVERKGINSLDKNNYHYIENLNNVISNIYNPSAYDQFINNKIDEDKEKLNIMLKCINEIECAYIYKYRSDNNIKLTFDVFCHNFYIFLSYNYKKKLSIKNFKNKYNQIKKPNEYEFSATQNIMQLNSIGVTIPKNIHTSTDNNNNNSIKSYEQEIMEKLNPFIFESEHIINELHSKNNSLLLSPVQLENNFFIKHPDYVHNMTKLIKDKKNTNDSGRLFRFSQKTLF